MKIVITAAGVALDAPLDRRFGRAHTFLVIDMESGSLEVVDNRQSLEAAQGAGIQAAETVIRSGAQGLITGHCGPKAFRVLTAAGVKVYHSGAATVAEALREFREGKLAEARSADVEEGAV